MVVPSRIFRYVGEPARLDCMAAGEVSWYFGSLENPPISVNTAIIFRHLELKHSGAYFCYGLYNKDHYEHFIAKATVHVQPIHAGMLFSVMYAGMLVSVMHAGMLFSIMF